MDTILQELNDIFKGVFSDDTLKVTIDNVPEDIEGWDSYAQIRLISGVEEHFGIKYKISELKQLNTVKTLVESIRKKKQGDK